MTNLNSPHSEHHPQDLNANLKHSTSFSTNGNEVINYKKSSQNSSKKQNFLLIMLLLTLGLAFGLFLLKNAQLSQPNTSPEPQALKKPSPSEKIIPTSTPQRQISQLPDPTDAIINDKNLTFSGVITDFSNECHYDGLCSLTIDERTVIVASAEMRNPNLEQEVWGQIIGLDIYGLNPDFIGRKAEVLARKISGPDGIYYSLVGDENYYVKIIDD
jgi:hypothetical protein